nr:MAG TPA: hypothetical protein [Caudoviricetes sp.]
MAEGRNTSCSRVSLTSSPLLNLERCKYGTL